MIFNFMCDHLSTILFVFALFDTDTRKYEIDTDRKMMKNEKEEEKKLYRHFN